MVTGADPGFQVRGGRTWKNCTERREARKLLGYFVWKITILCQKIIFFPIAEGGAKIFGVFRVKNHEFTPKNHIFSNFRGGGGARAGRAPPLDPPLGLTRQGLEMKIYRNRGEYTKHYTTDVISYSIWNSYFCYIVAAIIIGGINPNTQKKQQFVESHRQTLWP